MLISSSYLEFSVFVKMFFFIKSITAYKLKAAGLANPCIDKFCLIKVKYQNQNILKRFREVGTENYRIVFDNR